MYKAIKILLSQAINDQKLYNYSAKKCPNQVVGEVSIRTCGNNRRYNGRHFLKLPKNKNVVKNIMKEEI